MKLDKWQEEILESEGDILLCTGRQVGKTTIFAIKCARYLMNNPSHKVVIVSLTEDQAKLIIVMILDYLEKHAKTKIARGKHKPTQNKITLKNKATAIARPVGNTGDAVRGFTGDVLIIDEASRMPELAFIAMEPILMTRGGQIWICSTPHGKQGTFWKYYQNKEEHWKIWHISSEEVVHNRPISDDWTAERRERAIARLKSQKDAMSDLRYGQEYLGLFLDELRQFFPDELIDAACCLKRKGRNPHGRTVMGCDLARKGGDATTMEIIEVPTSKEKKCKHVENIIQRNLDTVQNEQLIIDTDNLWNNEKIGIDAGSGTLGVSIYDHLMNVTGIKRKLVAMNNRKLIMDREGKQTQRILKEDLYDNLKAMLQRKELLLLNEESVRLSLKSVQYEYDEDGKTTKVRIFSNPHDHSHVVEGLTRAAQLAKERKGLNIWIGYI